MDSFPEELLTPPVPLVALVGVPSVHPLLSAYILQQSPPIVTLSLPDLGTAVGTLRRGRTRASRPPEGEGRLGGVPGAHGSPFSGVPGAGAGGGAAHVPPPPPPPPQGILKAHWVRKHRERVPSALVLCLDQTWLAEGSSSEWAALCAALEAVKAENRSPQAKMVLLLINQGGDSVPLGRTSSGSGDEYQERLSILKKKAETDARSCVFFSVSQPFEQTRSLARLFSLLSELTSNFYRDQVRRMRLKVERRTYTHVELSVRYYFKMAVYHEFRREWLPAVKGYESAFMCLQEVLAGPPEQQPLQAVMEVKAVGEVITLKICTLLLHTGREVEAVGWFRNYVEWFRSRLGPPQGAFLHWTWMSRQYEVFGELLYQRLQVTGQLGDAPGVADVLPAPGAAPALGVASAGGLSREPSGPSGLLLLPEGLRASLPQYLSGAAGRTTPVAPVGSGGGLPWTPPGPGTPSSTGASMPWASSPLSSPFSSLSSTPTPSQPQSPLAGGPGDTPAMMTGEAGMPLGAAPSPLPVGALPVAAPVLPASPAPLAPTPISRGEAPLGPLGDRTDTAQGAAGNPSVSPAASSTTSSSSASASAGSSSGQYVGPFSSQSLRVPLVARVFQLAAKHKIRYRRAYEAALITLETFGIQGLTPSTSSTSSSSNRSGPRADKEGGSEEDVLADGRDDLLPPLYIGQPPRIPSRGSAPYQQRPADAEVLLHALVSIGRLQVSSAVIELLAKAHELYRSIHASRMMSHVASEMGREYFAAHDYGSCLRLLEGVAGVYRQEAFISLLSTTLSYLRECARQLGLLQSYVVYSLELAALPLFHVAPFALGASEAEAGAAERAQGKDGLDDAGSHALSSGVMMLMTGMGRSGPKDAPARPKRKGRIPGDAGRTSAGTGAPGASPAMALGPTGSGSELGPAGPPSEEQKRVIAREALGLLRGEREVLPAHEGDPGLRVTQEHPFELAISSPGTQLSHLRPVLVAAAAFHEPVAKCRDLVTLSLALLTHLPSALEPLELQVHFSQPGCDITLRHCHKASSPRIAPAPDAAPGPSGGSSGEPSRKEAQASSTGSEGDAEDGPGLAPGVDLRILPGCWKRFQLQVSAEESGILDCTSVSLRLGPHAVLACQVDSPQLAPQVPCWMYEEESILGTPLGPEGQLWLSLLGQKSVEVEEGAPQVRLELYCPPSGLLGENVPCRMRVCSLVPHTLYSLRLSLQVGPSELPAPPLRTSEGQPDGALGASSGPPALQSRLPVLPRGGLLGLARAAPEEGQGAALSGSAPSLARIPVAAEPGGGKEDGQAPSAAVAGPPAVLPVQLFLPKPGVTSSTSGDKSGSLWGQNGAIPVSEDHGEDIQGGAPVLDGEGTRGSGSSGGVTLEDGQSLVALGTSEELSLAPLGGYADAWVSFFLRGSTCCQVDVTSTLTYSRLEPSCATASKEGPAPTSADAPSASSVGAGAGDIPTAAVLATQGDSGGPPPPPVGAAVDTATTPNAGLQGLETRGDAADQMGTPSIAADQMGTPSIAADQMGTPSIAADEMGTPSIAADGTGNPSSPDDPKGPPSSAADQRGPPRSMPAAQGGLTGTGSLAGRGHGVQQASRSRTLRFEEPLTAHASLSGAWHRDALVLPGCPRVPEALSLATVWENLRSPGVEERPGTGPQEKLQALPARGDQAGAKAGSESDAGVVVAAAQGPRASWGAADVLAMQSGRGATADSASGKDAGPHRKSPPSVPSSVPSSWSMSGAGPIPMSSMEAAGGLVATPLVAGRGQGTGASATLLCLGEQSMLALIVQGVSEAAIRLLSMEVALTRPSAFQLQLTPGSPSSGPSAGGSQGWEGSLAQAEEGAGHEVEQGEGGRLVVRFSGGQGVVLQRDESFCELFTVTPVLEPEEPQGSTRLQPGPAPLGTVTFLWQRAMPQEVPGAEQGEQGPEEVGPESQAESREGLGQQPKGEGQVLALVPSQFQLPLVLVEPPALRISLECPPVAYLGRPLTYAYTLSNQTELLLEVSFQVQDVPSFVVAGTHSGTLSLLPSCSVRLPFQLVPIAAGLVAAPPIRLLASHHSAKFIPSAPSSRLFVYPSSAG